MNLDPGMAKCAVADAVKPATRENERTKQHHL